MLRYIFFILSLLLCLNSHIQAQNIDAAKLGFESYSIQDSRYGTINYYVTESEQESQKPLLLYLDGSGPIPLFQQMERGLGSSVVIDWQNLQEEYQIVLISKPGIPLVDEVEMDPKAGPQYDAPAEYRQRLSLDWRVGTADSVIKRLLAKGSDREVVAFGFSEGAQVAANLASTNTEIDYLLLFSGNGLNQLYDFIINARLKAERGQISHRQAQAEVDSLYNVFDDIYANPESTSLFWNGHTYKRWASFASNPPFEALRQVSIPIYIANGSRDRNPVLSADYTRLEFLRYGKTNITYRGYPDYNHQFAKLIFEDGQFKQAVPNIREVVTDAFDWLEKKRNAPVSSHR